MVSPHSANFSGRRHFGSGNYQDHVALWEGALKVSYHVYKFGGHRHCGSGDIMVFICHVTLQDYMIKRSCDFIEKSP